MVGDSRQPAPPGDARLKAAESAPVQPKSESFAVREPREPRGPAPDNEGHRRVAELLGAHWSTNLKGSLERLAKPKDGGPEVLPSRLGRRSTELSPTLKYLKLSATQILRSTLKGGSNSGKPN